jgi:hypothetical protein
MSRIPSHSTIKEKKRTFFESVIRALREHYIPFPSIDDPHAVAATLLEGFLSGQYESLDEAFGLKQPRAHPNSDEEYKQWVVSEALKHHQEGVPWTKIPETIGEQLDEKTIRAWRDESPVTEFHGIGKRHAIYLLYQRLESGNI